MRRIVIYIVILSSIFVAWGFCLASAQKMQAFNEMVELRYEEEALTQDIIKKMQQGESEAKNKLITSLLAWNEKKNQTLKNNEINRSINGSILQTYGDLSLFLTSGLVSGQLLYDDQEGTIISEAVAEALWGSTDVLGKELTVDEKVYSVKGILKDKEPVIILQMPENSEVMFKNLRVKMIDTNNIEEHIQTLNLKYNLPQGICDNLSLMSIFLSQLALVPGWLLGIYILIKWYRLIYKTHHYWVSASMLVVLGIALTWGIGSVMNFRLDIPAYLIPNQWSDFDFWSMKWDSLYENRQEIARMASYLPNEWYSQIKQEILISFILTLAGVGVFIKKITLRSGKELFWSVLLTIIISFSVIMGLYSLGIEVFIIPSFWIMLPLYLGIQFLMMKWEELLKT